MLVFSAEIFLIIFRERVYSFSQRSPVRFSGFSELGMECRPEAAGPWEAWWAWALGGEAGQVMQQSQGLSGDCVHFWGPLDVKVLFAT